MLLVFRWAIPNSRLTRGIVSKAQTSGETSWASVDEVLEHDATINPGNSGGPLINEDGKVVGVNYSGSSETSQYYAIARAEALDIIDRLQEGEDVTSIGVNGEAVQGDGITGIWVSSVKSGSPADESRIQPGDIITSIEGLVLANRRHDERLLRYSARRRPDDTMSIEVLRFSTQEQLTGQLNGRELEVAFSFAQQEAESAPPEDDNVASYTDYRSVTDDTGALQVQVPVEWGENRGLSWAIDDVDVGGEHCGRAEHRLAFMIRGETPGVFFGASRSLIGTYDENTILDTIDFGGQCTYDGRELYEDALYTGLYDTWSACGGSDTELYVISVVPEDRSFLGLVQIQVVTNDDLVALDQIIRTFQVVGTLP
ncbi:MAG: PDZ domain-containing protein [Blastochloris sp.]|nr:PDZ domain-containing protein [Blastochloris sp.]